MKEQTLSERLHLDVPLLFGLTILCLIGLVVLYSAAGQTIVPVARQATRLLLGFVLMFAVAQLPTPQQRLESGPVPFCGVGVPPAGSRGLLAPRTSGENPATPRDLQRQVWRLHRTLHMACS